MTKLADFMKSNHNNEWLAIGNMMVYVRKGRHAFGSLGLIDTIDIANITVQPDYQNQGVFTKFLEEAETLGLAVHIENVLTERFANFFRKRGGYDIVYEDCGMASFLRL